MTDDGGWRPGALPVQALDHATGYGAAAAAILLLASRRRTGRGGAAKLSLARTAEELFSLPHNSQEPGMLPDPDYSEGGVPSFDFVRDKIENRYTTSLGSVDVAGLGTENTAEALDKKIADRDQAAKDRLAAIRRSMRGE